MDDAWDRIVADLYNVEDVDRAVAAIDRLNEAADESWLPRLHQLLAEGRDFFVREAAAYPIARLKGVKALPQLLHAMALGTAEGHDNDGLSDLIIDLVAYEGEAAAPMLRAMITDTSRQRRVDAAWLWGAAARALPCDPLLAAMKDADAEVRGAAAGSLPAYKCDPRILPALIQALDDADDRVRASATSSLGYLGDKTAIPHVRRMLDDDPSDEVRRVATYALDQLGERPWWIRWN